jgi:hypothetical protein
VTGALTAAVRDMPPAAKPAAGKPPERHHPALLAALAAELRCSPGEIVDLELNVCDTQPGAIGGAQAAGPRSGQQRASLQECVPCSSEGGPLRLVLSWCCGSSERSKDCVDAGVGAGEGVQMQRAGRAARLTGALRAGAAQA